VGTCYVMDRQSGNSGFLGRSRPRSGFGYGTAKDRTSDLGLRRGKFIVALRMSRWSCFWRCWSWDSSSAGR